MSERFAIVGLGQLGRLVGAGLLALGHPIEPILRGTPGAERRARLARAERVLVAVGEDDLATVLDELPAALRDGRTWLLQNELSPSDWAGVLTRPTVMAFWAEKKAGKPLSVVLTTPVAGPDRALAVAALAAIDVPAAPIDDGALVGELALKNLYILVSNLAGLAAFPSTSGTVGELQRAHSALLHAVAEEVLAVEEARLARALDRPALLARLAAAFDADPCHACRGRSAPARLDRTLARARALGVAVPHLAELAERIRPRGMER
jgi:hypothetical protein